MAESPELQTMRDFILAVVEEQFPGLAAGHLAPIRARVERVAGARADLQALARDGSDDTEAPPIPRVPIPVGLVLAKGTMVRVGYYYGDRNQPFIHGLVD